MQKYLYEIDSGIQSLLDSCALGILNEKEMNIMLSLKSSKEKYMAHEPLTWKLKRRIKWNELGDANTKLFHSYASYKKILNSIWDFKDEMVTRSIIRKIWKRL